MNMSIFVVGVFYLLQFLTFGILTIYMVKKGKI